MASSGDFTIVSLNGMAGMGKISLCNKTGLGLTTPEDDVPNPAISYDIFLPT